MKYKLYNLIILVVSIFIISPVLSQNELLKREIISRVIDSIDAHNQLEFEMYRSERNENNEFIEGKFYAKLVNRPYKIYIKNEKPRKGAELLYVDGENDGKALVNPNTFPYINLSISPENSILLAGGHHYITEAGFNQMSKTFKFYIGKYKDLFIKMIHYEGIFKWDNKKCHKLRIEYDDYKKISYYAKSGETVNQICQEKLINIAKIKELNPEIGIKKNLYENQKIIITNHYSKTSILYINLENYFPIYQMIYDEKGLYEKYIYGKLLLNKEIKKEEFGKEYKDYNF